MEGLLGGVFANHSEYYPAGMAGGALEPIHEEWSATPKREACFAFDRPRKRSKLDLACHVCLKTFTEKRSLVRHLKTTCRQEGCPPERPACSFPDCHETFSRVDVRNRHEEEQHGNVKRHQPRLNLLPRLNRRTANRSKPKDSSSRFNVNTPESASGLSHLQSDHRALTYALSHDDAALSFGTSPSTSVYSSSDSKSETNTSPSNYGKNRLYKRRESSSAGSAISSGSSLKYSTTNTSFTTFGSDVDQHSIQAETCDSRPRVSQDDDWLSRRRVSFELHPRRDLLKSGASARPGSVRRARVCPICSKSFGHTVEEVRTHLDLHYQSNEREHECDKCQIGFDHQADLDLHLLNADNGSCGFPFEHRQKCTGHHPPTHDQLSMSDADDAKLYSYRLRNWEQSQLREYRILVNDVIEYVASRSDTWSVDALRKSIKSVSILFSGLDIRSTPEPMERHLKTAIHRVRRSLGDRLPIGPDSSFKIKLRKKWEDDVRFGRELVKAAGDGNLEKMDELVRRGAPSDGVFQFNCGDGVVSCTPLMAAVCSGNVKAVDCMLKSGSPVNGLTSPDDLLGTTPLCLAAAGGNIDIVRSLLSHKANIDEEARSHGGHAACYAARNGHTEILSLLIDHGTNVHLIARVDNVTDASNFRSIPLSRGNILALAAYHGRTETVEMLLGRPEIDFDYCDSSAALAMAAYQGNVALIYMLLGYYPQLCTYSAVWIADSLGHSAVVDTLIEHQRRIKLKLELRSRRALESALRQGLQDLTSRMLSPHTDGRCDTATLACRQYEFTAAEMLVARAHPGVSITEELSRAMVLNCAVYYQDLQVVRTLLLAGIDANARIYPSSKRYLSTNLSLAVRMGRAEIVELLIRCGAKAVQGGHLSLELLEAALESKSVETLPVLLNNGLEVVSIQDQYSCSSFNAAVQRVVCAGEMDLLKALIDGGLDINQVHVEEGSFKKTTLLHMAAGCVPEPGSLETIKLLLENGADPRNRPSSRTPSDIVYLRGMELGETHEEFGILEKAIDLLEFWERRVAMVELEAPGL